MPFAEHRVGPLARHDAAELAGQVLLGGGLRRGERQQQPSRWARTAGRLSTVLVASSRAHTHSTASSSGRLQSEANCGDVGGNQQELVRRRPRHRQRVLAEGPLRQVADDRAGLQPDEHGADGRHPLAEHGGHAPGRVVAHRVETGHPGRRRRLAAPAGGGAARADSTGRHDSRARSVQSPRPTGTHVSRRPSGVTGMPVASTTFSSATRDSCSTWIRWTGSTLASGVPPVATLRANERVVSQVSGPFDPSMFIMSPSSDWNGLLGSPGSGVVMRSMLRPDPATRDGGRFVTGPEWAPGERCVSRRSGRPRS